MSRNQNIIFNHKEAIKEIDHYRSLLESNMELSEKKEILPFFRNHRNLTALISMIFPDFSHPDMLAYEYSIYEDFKCDVFIGDSRKKAYCFIEFEDAKENSIFTKKTNRISPEWSPRFEHGYSQIIDWFWKLDDMSSTGDFRRIFGEDRVFYGLLLIGRNTFLDEEMTNRLKWRQSKTLVDSKHIYCRTFDDLNDFFNDKKLQFIDLP